MKHIDLNLNRRSSSFYRDEWARGFFCESGLRVFLGFRLRSNVRLSVSKVSPRKKGWKKIEFNSNEGLIYWRGGKRKVITGIMPTPLHWASGVSSELRVRKFIRYVKIENR